MDQELAQFKKDLEGTRSTVNAVLHLLERMSDAMSEGFDKVNQRLSELEGKNGMQGVNQQLGDIKTELHKIQKAYPYDDIVKNLDHLRGQA
jgi:archaellum component FlaC